MALNPGKNKTKQSKTKVETLNKAKTGLTKKIKYEGQRKEINNDSPLAFVCLFVWLQQLL